MSPTASATSAPLIEWILSAAPVAPPAPVMAPRAPAPVAPASADLLSAILADAASVPVAPATVAEWRAQQNARDAAEAAEDAAERAAIPAKPVKAAPVAAPVLVTGNTYPVKDALKAMGARWDGTAKGWRVPADRATEAQALVNSARRAPAPRYAPRQAPAAPAAPVAMIALYGETYMSRGAIKAMGGRWNAQAKVWTVPVSRVGEATALPGVTAEEPGAAPRSRASCGWMPGQPACGPRCDKYCRSRSRRY